MTAVTIPEAFLNKALQLADDAARADEVPVGAVICELTTGGEGVLRVIGEGRNRIRERRDPTAHAEMLALRAACEVKRSERLTDCILISTLEPCLMCSGAIILARLQAVYYFAPLESGLGMMDVLQLQPTREKGMNHQLPLIPIERYRETASGLLREYFLRKRGNG